MGCANMVYWNGPAQDISYSSPVYVVDMFGNRKLWNITVYANGGHINPNIPNMRRLKVVDINGNGNCDLQISNVSATDEGLYRCEIYQVKGKPLTKQYILYLKRMYYLIIYTYNTYTMCKYIGKIN